MRTARGVRVFLTIGSSLIAFAASAAHAQQAAPAAQPQADSGSIQDIIVTARRRNESIQTTPVAVTAVSPSQLEASAATKLSDLQGLAPNVLITTQSTGAATANISIRGIAFADVEKSFDPAVGVNVDGVYIGTSTGQLLDFFDISSIEILRGPQGTLFGRNTIAGVINVRRTRPTGEWGGKFEASYGSYEQIGLRGVLNAPIVKDVLAVKLFEFRQEDGGFLKEFGTGKHIGGSYQDNFGAAFLLTPSSNFDALLTLEEQHQTFEAPNGLITRTGDVFCGALPAVTCNRNTTTDIYTIFPGQVPSTGRYRAPAATLEMNLTAGPVKLTSVTSYRSSTESQTQDFGTANLYLATRRQKYHQFSQELRASGNLFPNFDYVAGLYYFNSRYRLIQDTNVFGSFAGEQFTIGKSRSEAAFIDFDWEFLPRLRLSGGGRYTHDRKENINPQLIDPNDGSVGVSAKKSWSRFTPKVSLDYRPTDALMVYGSWSRGYRSGGFNGRGQTFFSATTPYNPETVDAYEVGVKSEFFDRKLALNLAGYYTDYKNIQESSTVTLVGGIGNETVVTNAAGARIKGIEADLTARPIDPLTIRGSLGYTHSHFRGFLVNQPVTLADGSVAVRTFDFSDVDLIYAPKITAAVNAEYKIPVGANELRLNAGYRYITRYDQQIAADPALYPTLLAQGNSTSTVIVPRNDPRLRSDRQHLLDASISYIFAMNGRGAKFRLTAFVRNALDDRGTNTAFDVAAFPTLWGFTAAREPRVFGGQFGFEF
jgi:iron complex outermembrane recepter protein